MFAKIYLRISKRKAAELISGFSFGIEGSYIFYSYKSQISIINLV
ncbi:MAG: hypothetical protein AVDCRST_MAG95-57 [uncultured Adhaeribacter sp.]|uniref:Uncharacterized protein n=1 Tax=uncultured Adhaeribacter sp. TaxID=448109 RepID=A0A6J4H337_9BACT|nr:MAG: hypothetical protein AVDCRST_MAG95-57 [uncultured Adhaeribacter sp.]